MKASYQTPARRALLDFFSAHPEQHFTAEQICAYFADHPEYPIGKSTVYRQLSHLCEQDALRRFEEADPETGISVHVYQHFDAERDCDHHFHLKCLLCGKVQHLSCDKTAGLLEHILGAHGFSVDCGRSILYGVCEDCAPARLPVRRDDHHTHQPKEKNI